MNLRSLLSAVRRFGGAVLLGVLIPANIAGYRTVWRDYHTQEVPVDEGTNLLDAIKSAPGDSLEEKVHEVIYEMIDFDEEEVGDKFRDRLFGYLSECGSDIKGSRLALEDKINYAQKFSSALEYNYNANFIDSIAYPDREGNPDALGSIAEYIKINNMSSEEIVEYHDVVCGQYSQVFAAALHAINSSSANPEEILVGQLYYVPNYDLSYGPVLDIVVSSLNALGFSEWRSSLAHAKNIVVTDGKLYLIEPQERVDLCSYDSPVSFSYTALDIDSKYADKIR